LDTLQSTAPVGFLFLDRDCRYVRVNETAAAIDGIAVEDHVGRRVEELVPALWAQIEGIYRRVLDQGETVLNAEMTGETSAEPGRVRFWLTNHYPVRVDEEIIGIGVIIVDITDRKEAEVAQKQSTKAAIAAVAATVEARDPYTAGHQRRTAGISAAIATEMGLDPVEVEGIMLAAEVHDLGKIAVPAEILARPTRLTAVEFELVKTHSKAGYDILKDIPFRWPIAELVLQHHERLDGSGYPAGLRGDEIHLGARIIAVADVVESMASHRPYRPSLGIDRALEEITRYRGILFDPAAVDACIGLYEAGRLSSAPANPGSAAFSAQCRVPRPLAPPEGPPTEGALARPVSHLTPGSGTEAGPPDAARAS
ncbi:MAG: HD domain-containing phosphohydrolase, partial [Gemmatimonadales bacterium]